jgi:hypothetical protein
LNRLAVIIAAAALAAGCSSNQGTSTRDKSNVRVNVAAMHDSVVSATYELTIQCDVNNDGDFDDAGETIHGPEILQSNGPGGSADFGRTCIFGLNCRTTLKLKSTTDSTGVPVTRDQECVDEYACDELDERTSCRYNLVDDFDRRLDDTVAIVDLEHCFAKAVCHQDEIVNYENAAGTLATQTTLVSGLTCELNNGISTENAQVVIIADKEDGCTTPYQSQPLLSHDFQGVENVGVDHRAIYWIEKDEICDNTDPTLGQQTRQRIAKQMFKVHNLPGFESSLGWVQCRAPIYGFAFEVNYDSATNQWALGEGSTCDGSLLPSFTMKTNETAVLAATNTDTSASKDVKSDCALTPTGTSTVQLQPSTSFTYNAIPAVNPKPVVRPGASGFVQIDLGGLVEKFTPGDVNQTIGSITLQLPGALQIFNNRIINSWFDDKNVQIDLNNTAVNNGSPWVIADLVAITYVPGAGDVVTDVPTYNISCRVDNSGYQKQYDSVDFRVLDYKSGVGFQKQWQSVCPVFKGRDIVNSYMLSSLTLRFQNLSYPLAYLGQNDLQFTGESTKDVRAGSIFSFLGGFQQWAALGSNVITLMY